MFSKIILSVTLFLFIENCIGQDFGGWNRIVRFDTLGRCYKCKGINYFNLISFHQERRSGNTHPIVAWYTLDTVKISKNKSVLNITEGKEVYTYSLLTLLSVVISDGEKWFFYRDLQSRNEFIFIPSEKILFIRNTKGKIITYYP